MRVLLVELDGTGHRFAHVRLLAEEALRRGDEVTVLARDHPDSRQHLGVHLGGLRDRLDVREVARPSWGEVVATAREVGAAVTVVPEADGWLVALLRDRGWRGPGRLSLQVMRLQAVRAGRTRARWATVNAAKRATMVLADGLPRVGLRVLRSPLWQGRSRWRPSLDPVDLTGTDGDAEALARTWDLTRDRTWFAVLGAVTENKNLPLVARAVAVAARSTPCGLLVAGAVSPTVAARLPGVRDDLAGAGAEVRVVDRLLSDLELDSAVRAADVLVVAYDHLGPSGTLVKAVGVGTRVVAAGSPSLRDDAAAAPGTVSWCPLDAEAVAGELVRAAAAPTPPPVPLPDGQAFARALLGPR